MGRKRTTQAEIERGASVRAALNQFILAKNLTQTAWSKAAGVSEGTLRNFLSGTSQTMQHATLEKLAAAVGATVDEITGKASSSQVRQDLTLNSPHNLDDNDLPDNNVTYAPEKDPQRMFAPGTRDVPLYGTAMCGEDGAFEMNTGEVLEYKPRFEKLTNPRAFCILAEGDSNERHMSHGDLLFVDPARKPLVGRFALIELHPAKPGEGPRSFVKMVVAINSEFIRVEQFNPAKEWNIPTKKIKSAYLILKNQEMI